MRIVRLGADAHKYGKDVSVRCVTIPDNQGHDAAAPPIRWWPCDLLSRRFS